MKHRIAGVACLALALTLFAGGAATVGAHGFSVVPLAATSPSSRAVGAGLSAPLLRTATAPSSVQEAACATAPAAEPAG